MYKLIKNRKLWLVLVIIFLFLGLINYTSTNRKDITVLEKMIRDMYTPLQGGVTNVSDFFKDFGSIFANKRNLDKQIISLKKENAQLKLENQSLQEDTDELLRLQSIVNFKEVNNLTYDLTAARIIARSPSNWYKTLVIDKGSNQGIRKDMAVISPDGLVGRIGSISQNSAQVFLITDREVAVGAILQRTRETNGIVEGRGDSNLLEMKNIPYYSQIRKGDRVITSGLSEYYPKGILIGTIKQTKKEPGGLLLSATVSPGVSFDKLEEVLVVTGYRPPAETNNNPEEQ